MRPMSVMISCNHKFTCTKKNCLLHDEYPLLEETTNTLAYYILRSLLFYNIFDFIKLFFQNNRIYSDIKNVDEQIVEIMNKTLYDKNFHNDINMLMNEFKKYKKKYKSSILINTMRMSCIEIQ